MSSDKPLDERMLEVAREINGHYSGTCDVCSRIAVLLTAEVTKEVKAVRSLVENADFLEAIQKYAPKQAGQIELQTCSQIVGYLNEKLEAK